MQLHFTTGEEIIHFTLNQITVRLHLNSCSEAQLVGSVNICIGISKSWHKSERFLADGTLNSPIKCSLHCRGLFSTQQTPFKVVNESEMDSRVQGREEHIVNHLGSRATRLLLNRCVKIEDKTHLKYLSPFH